MARRKSIHYVNNAQFSQAVVDYVGHLEECRRDETTLPKVPDYIAQCFLRIAEGLSHKANFIRYTYREEMVMDAVENCLKAVSNYNLEAATRTGKPNAFAYFTQITWYAFLRRIAKEKKQQDIKFKYMSQTGVESFLLDETDNAVSAHFIDTLRGRIEKVKEYDTEVKAFVKKEKKRRRPMQKVDSDLTKFFK